MSEKNPTKGRVLLVEDDADLASLYGAYLTAERYQVSVATTGADALRQISEAPPDVLLLDVMLPDISGFEICRKVRRSPVGADVSIILVTALSDSESRTKAFHADADEFLSKPAIKEELLARVASSMRLRAALRQHQQARLDLEVEKRQRIRQLFGKYVSSTLIDELLEHSTTDWPSLLAKKERVDGTVMFTDIRGFTRYAESLDPEQVVTFLNEHFEMLTECADSHGGTVLNMTGDGLLLAFGTPLPLENPVLSAVRAANAMHEGFRAHLSRLPAQQAVPIGLGIGIHSGPVIVGNVGSDSYMAYTVIGDVVNVASRAQAIALPGHCVITAQCHDQLGELGRQWPCKHLQNQTMRGRDNQLDLYTLDMNQPVRR